MPAPYDLIARQFDGFLRRRGQQAILRRQSGDRPCLCAIVAYKPVDDVGKLTNPTDRRALISPFVPGTTTLLDPPNSELDRLVTDADGPLVILAPIGKIAPAGVVVAYDVKVATQV